MMNYGRSSKNTDFNSHALPENTIGQTWGSKSGILSGQTETVKGVA